ncbi:MAG: CBS domain-containing protein [Thermoleophilia bacterium]
MARCLGIELVDASVPADATIGRAARTLADAHASALAVLGPDGHVIGTFTQLDLVRSVFPPYLAELHHTAGLLDDREAMAERVADRSDDPLPRPTTRPVTVEIGTSAIHVAELFLHTGLPALPVVDGERFVGMLELVAFCRAIVPAP